MYLHWVEELKILDKRGGKREWTTRSKGHGLKSNPVLWFRIEPFVQEGKGELPPVMGTP